MLIIISAFIESIKTVKGLEKYWLSNKKAIKTMRDFNEQNYHKLIENFKSAKAIIIEGEKNEENT